MISASVSAPPKLLALLRHEAAVEGTAEVRPARPVGVAVHLAVVRRATRVDERGVLLEGREREEDLAVAQLAAHAAGAAGPVAARARAVDLLALAEWAGDGLLGGLQGPGVQQDPQREQADDRHGPPRDLRARLGRGHVRRIRPGRRRRRLGGRGRSPCGDRRCRGRRRGGPAGGDRCTARRRCCQRLPRPPRRAPSSAPVPPSVGRPSAARRSRERLRRCSGISVTGVLSTRWQARAVRLGRSH